MAEVLKRKKEEEEQKAPLWMVTMSDMNTLLMTFFIVLFSMLTEDKPLYMFLREYFNKMSQQTNPTTEGTSEQVGLERDVQGDDPGVEDFDSILDEARPPWADIRITKTRKSYIIPLSGDNYGFPQGEYVLSDRQKEVLDWVKRRMRGHRQNVVVRGYTDADLLDAYLLEGPVMRPARAGDPEPDHFLLSALRAQEARDYLIGGQGHIDFRQVRMGAYGKQHLRETEPKKAAFNRRVEIEITSQINSLVR